jgi:hypothetical protein
MQFREHMLIGIIFNRKSLNRFSVRFCPSCGKIIQPTASICYNCNNQLSSTNIDRQYAKNLDESINAYHLGINLENFVEDTLLRTGYINTEKRKKLKVLVVHYTK